MCQERERSLHGNPDVGMTTDEDYWKIVREKGNYNVEGAEITKGDVIRRNLRLSPAM